MNPFSKSPLPVVLDPVAAAIIAQMQQQVEEKDRQITRRDQVLATAELMIQRLKEELRLERIRKYGKRSEKLSDLQLELLGLEPAVSSEEIEAERARDPLTEESNEETKTAPAQQQKSRKKHTGRNELPAHLERVEKIIACTPAQCACGQCGGQTRVIGYEETEVLDMKPIEFFVTVLKREKRACGRCIQLGVQTAATVARIAPKSLFSDAVAIDFVVKKYCDALPLYRQRAMLRRDLVLDVALSTINDAVLRVGEFLIPVVDATKRDLLAGDYMQADETPVGVQTPDKKGSNHRGYFWQYSSPGRGVVFDFEMTRSGAVPRAFFKDYRGILHTDGYSAYGDDVGAEGMIHACCLAHARRKFIEAVKVNAKSKTTDADSARVVVLMDTLFAIDREAREQNLSIEDRSALRQERAPELLDELHAVLMKMKDRLLPKSAAGKAVSYTLRRWEKLTRFMQHPVIELSTNWAENSMRPIAIGRRNWLHLGSKEAGPKIAAIFSVVESCRRLDVPIRQYLADVLPGLADRSIQSLADLTPTAYAAKLAK
jgi:transposase